MSHTKYRQEKDCLNCGAEVQQKYCPQCGQANLEYKDNFWHLTIEVIGDFFHYDSKVLKSVKPLFTNPGFLTKEYQAGKRAAYIQPLRLFFFCTIVMVIVAGVYYKKFEKEIAEERVNVTNDGGTETKKISSLTEKEYTEEVKKSVEGVKHAFESIFHNLKYISFFLLPFYALAFWLIYRKHKSFYVDHIIFVLHVQSFAYVVLAFLMLISVYVIPATRDWIGPLFILAFFLYLAKSLRFIYHEKWGKTILKTVLSSFLVILISLFVVAGYFAFIFMNQSS